MWHKDTDLSGLDCLIVPGGFSYGDYLRPGAIARFSPVMPAVQKFADNGGLVIGICNGFQILCEAGMLPGVLTPQLPSAIPVPMGQPSRRIQQLAFHQSLRSGGRSRGSHISRRGQLLRQTTLPSTRWNRTARSSSGTQTQTAASPRRPTQTARAAT